MTRETLDRKIQELLDEVLLLGSMVEQATLNAVRALKTRNLEQSKTVYDGDAAINDKRFELEERTITIIATQQPMARDLRILTAILEVITELERMGDYAKGIGRINLNLGAESTQLAPTQFVDMAEIGVDMLHKALEAFVNGDEKKARQIPKLDDEVDKLFNEVHRDLLNQMAQQQGSVEDHNHLLWAAHNLERLADRVTNICERTIFVVTGQLIELDMSDDENRNR
ncbi:MAG: phosphate signaling complex protein PhoU [Chloroflexi bacterium]|nr:phosphate signaling complex protein PhoU [Chloroflexota bacterium]